MVIEMVLSSCGGWEFQIVKSLPKALKNITSPPLHTHNYTLSNSTIVGRKPGTLCFRYQLGEQRKQVSRKTPPHTCQLLASCSVGRMQRQLGLVFLGFSPWSFPAGPARGQNLEYSESTLQHLSPLTVPEKIWPVVVGTTCLLHFHRERAFKMIVFFSAPCTTKRNQDSLEKWLTPGVGLDMDEISLGQLVPESKEAIRTTGSCGKNMESNLQGLSVAKDALWVTKRIPFIEISYTLNPL